MAVLFSFLLENRLSDLELSDVLPDAWGMRERKRGEEKRERDLNVNYYWV